MSLFLTSNNHFVSLSIDLTVDDVRYILRFFHLSVLRLTKQLKKCLHAHALIKEAKMLPHLIGRDRGESICSANINAILD